MKKQNSDFKSQSQNNSTYYDLFDDWSLIESSFASQYGIRLRKEPDMTWGEFSSLLSGLLPDTPLGEIVSVRCEQDAKKIETFTPVQRKIYDNWQRRMMQENPRIYDKKLEQIEKIFLAFGVKQNGT